MYSLLAEGINSFRKHFADQDVQFLVLAVRFRSHRWHLSAGAGSQHSNKKVLTSCLWRSALPGVAPFVIANHCPENKLTRRVEPSPLQTDIWPPAICGREQTWFNGLNSEFKLRPLPPNQRVANGRYITWIKSNQAAQWGYPRPWPSSCQEAVYEWWLCFRIPEVRKQSYYTE